MKLKFIILTVILVCAIFDVKAQLSVSLFASDTVVCSGDSVNLSALIVNGSLFSSLEDFEDANLDTSVFIQNNSIDYSNPCGAGPAGSLIHCWFGSLSSFPRILETKPLLLDSSYAISFDIRYAADENSLDCEDPDQPNEGVHFQYSLDNGVNWIEIEYWEPNSTYTGQIYSWLSYASAIPDGALCSPVKYRWWQDLTSGNNWDHWGIDNISITTDTGLIVSWAHDPLLSAPYATVFPVTDTFYVITINDTIHGFTVSDTVFISVPEIDTTISQNINTLSIAEPNAIYQWIDCDSNMIITGATSQEFEITHSGNYAVDIISEHGCHIQTGCITFIFNNIDDFSETKLKCYPNPTSSTLYIESEVLIEQIQILDLSGRVLYTKMTEANKFSVDISTFSDGDYLLSLLTNDVIISRRLTIISK